MNMDTLGKLAAPATAKIRQLQKIVQDIKKNDGSLLNKLKRLKSKPLPKVPARDYRDNDRKGDDQLSQSDDDNDDTYENPHDDSYEPPPSHRDFKTTPSAAFPRGEYLDSCHNRPTRAPRKPLRPGKASRQLPPEPTQSDEEDYISPDGINDDDNYIEPAENPPATPKIHGVSRTGMDCPTLPTPLPLPERPPSPDFYEVPDKEESSLSLPASRHMPPIPSPRLNMRTLPSTEPTGNDEYEVCDPDDCSSNKPAEGPSPVPPKPFPRERSPKPTLMQKPVLKQREFESRTLPGIQTDHKPPLKAFSLDMKRPKLPLPQLTSPEPTDIGSLSADKGSIDQNKDADICKKPWYASTCNRKTADDILFRSNTNGAFMVRKSSGQDTQQPYTLVVFYRGRVYNIPIRFIPATQQYARSQLRERSESCVTE